MALTSSKEILATYNFLTPEEKKKHAHHEFQAFAYRLASDLNDLVNLRIYLRLAKNIERSIMERAYSFAVDAKGDNKGKAFFWKLREIRAEIQRYSDFQNFDYDFVIKKMKSFRNKTAGAQIKTYEESKLPVIQEFTKIDSRPKSKVLVITTPSIRLINFLYDNFKKVYVADLSNQINNKLEVPFVENHKKITFKSTDFLKTRFKDDTFKCIYIDSYWNFLPKDAELKFLEALKRILKRDGVIFLNLRKAIERKEEWKTMISGEQRLDYFTKVCTRKDLNYTLSKMGFKSKKFSETENYEMFEISRS